MFQIVVKTDFEEKTQFFEERILLSEALEQMGFAQNKPCGGKGLCGKCVVRANGEEVRSCVTYVEGDMVVEDIRQQGDIRGMTEGFMPKVEGRSLVEEGFGMAIDIGTTTIAAYLYEFPEGRCVKTFGLPNTQAEYGADVISRIEYCERGGLSELQGKVVEQIRKLAQELAGVRIEKYVITGNTVMLHLLTGLNPQGIAYAPFIPESLFGEWWEQVYLPRCISAYVGADITTAILASGLCAHKCAFLVDIGTNGEMALWKNSELFCCSTAAGPALEGANISQGMLAVEGAINKVYLVDGKIQYTTIQNVEAKGICGSGLLDAISCMLELEILGDTGYLEETYEIGNSGVCISPDDIRQVQLAKAAIRAGIETLLHKSETSYQELEAFYIAGGFGSYISIDSAVKIGLLPEEIRDKVIVIGNGAGNGAAMILQSEECLRESERIAAHAHTEELATSAFFTDSYIENMMFPVE